MPEQEPAESTEKKFRLHPMVELTPKQQEPIGLTIRAYQVGFGDCFLLTFKYPEGADKTKQERHVLIDFGSTGMPKDAGPKRMKEIAANLGLPSAAIGADSEALIEHFCDKNR